VRWMRDDLRAVNIVATGWPKTSGRSNDYGNCQDNSIIQPTNATYGTASSQEPQLHHSRIVTPANKKEEQIKRLVYHARSGQSPELRLSRAKINGDFISYWHPPGYLHSTTSSVATGIPIGQLFLLLVRRESAKKLSGTGSLTLVWFRMISVSTTPGCHPEKSCRMLKPSTSISPRGYPFGSQAVEVR